MKLLLLLLLGQLQMAFGQDVGNANSNNNNNGSVFSPIVTATCRAGTMTIKLETLENFVGVVQSRDYRKPQCSGYGENSRVTFLRINMVAEPEDEDYCGVFMHETSEEYSVAVAVRIHRTLETARDKFYMITCGKAGFQNTRNETSLVNLELLSSEKKVQQVVYGREYTLRAHFSKPDGKFGMKVKRCFSFSDTNNTVQLVDERGCPDPNLMSLFSYNNVQGVAEATLFSMFKFPESNRVHFQCDILVCKGPCRLPRDCGDTFQPELASNGLGGPEGRALGDPVADALLQQPEDGALMASYSVFVLEPGEKIDIAPVCPDCNADPTSSVFFWPCIIFGFLFFVLLVVLAFLLSAVTCSCVSSEVERKRDKEKKAREAESAAGSGPVEEFDPYAKSWHGSQYGSRLPVSPVPQPGAAGQQQHSLYATNSTSLRYSLSGALKPMPVPYIPATSSSDHSHKSLASSSNNSSSTRRQSPARSARSRSRSRPRSNLDSKKKQSTTSSSSEGAMSSSAMYAGPGSDGIRLVR